MRVPFERMTAEFQRVLGELGMSPPRSELCARLFAQASLDGVASHGLNRFGSFVRSIRQGRVDAQAAPRPLAAFGPMERWDGQRGPGPLNAHFAMGRAIELARQHTMGCVALRNTTHWMRAGNCGWQAAEAGCIALCWTNTISNVPPWGARTATVGNNPLVIAVPRPGRSGPPGEAGHIVLDMAMSLFSWGRMDSYRRAGQVLPVEGGYDEQGRLTRDPDAIFKSHRPLPAGLWKGSGLALMLDLLATILSGGNATWQIDRFRSDLGVCQVFIAFDASRLPQTDVRQIADDVLRHYASAQPLQPGGEVLYPGQRAWRARQENLAQGIPVDEEAWANLLKM